MQHSSRRDLPHHQATPEIVGLLVGFIAPEKAMSPDITAMAVGGHRLRFRRLGFVLKFTR